MAMACRFSTDIKLGIANQFRQVPYKIILIRLDPLIDALL